MASLTEAELKKAIKEDAPGQLYYLYGNEKFLIKLYYDKLVEKIAGKHPSDFSFHTFRTLDNIDQIAVATGAVPFMGGRNFVGIADADASKLSDGEFSKLMELLENIPQGTAVVVAQLTANPDMGKAKNKKLLAALTKLGNAVQLNKMGVDCAPKAACYLGAQARCGAQPGGCRAHCFLLRDGFTEPAQ